VAAGRELLWLHSFAERCIDADADRPVHLPEVEGIGWKVSVDRMPQTMADIVYDAETGNLKIADGIVSGVRPEVWAYSVSGMPVLRKWLGYRTARGSGRATSSSSGLDRIRPTAWPDVWNDELLDLIRVLTLTLERQEVLETLLDQICAGPLISATTFPVPTEAERKVPV
jgi:Type ISP C-terminal specificity domain